MEPGAWRVAPTDRTWRHASLTVRGRHHDICQDSATSVDMEEGAVGLVVADGCGSAARSHEGSALAVEIAAVMLESLPWKGSTPDLWRRVVQRCFGKVRDKWLTKAGAGAYDMRTTLAIAVVDRFGVAYATVGDSYLFIARDGSRVIPYTPADERGTYANETRFLTSEHNEPAMATFLDTGIRHACLSTDGLEMQIERKLTICSNGSSTPSLWGVRGTIERMLVERRGACRPESLRTTLEHPKAMDGKGDDIGVAVASR